METPKKAGTIFIDLDLNTAPLKETLKNLLTAIEATEKKGIDIDLSNDNFKINSHEGESVLNKSESEEWRNGRPTFGIVIDGKLFDTADVEIIKAAIERGEIIL